MRIRTLVKAVFVFGVGFLAGNAAGAIIDDGPNALSDRFENGIAMPLSFLCGAAGAIAVLRRGRRRA